MGWLPIETAPCNIFRPVMVRVKYDDGRELNASWGWDDEIYDQGTGEETLLGAWHKDGNINETIPEPDYWMPLPETPNAQ